MNVLKFLFFPVLLLVLAFIAARLVGARPSWRRALVVGFVGIATGGAFVGSEAVQQGYDPSKPFNFSNYAPIFFTIALVAIMLTYVALELLGGTGTARQVRRRGSGIPHPIRAVRRRFARWARYLQITRIAAGYGLAPYLGIRRGSRAAKQQPGARPRKLWARVRAALEEAGGAFVKLGQVLSTRPDVLPTEALLELAGLQDQVAPAPRAAIEALLAEELSAPVTDLFDEFDPKPLAAASIAQVYRARLSSGEAVVVKVQRPGIREPIERDLDILLNLARTIEARAAWAQRFGVLELAAGFAEALKEELDFRIEARNTVTVTATLAGGKSQPGVCIPRVFSHLSTSRVLVLEHLDGVSVREAGPLIEEQKLSRLELARTLLRSMLHQIMRDGTFHADPHPGNILVLRDGRLALIDFGSVGRLDPIQQTALKQMLIALDRRDALLLSDALLDLAQAREAVTTADEDRLVRALAQLMAQRLGPGMPLGPALFQELFELVFAFGLAFPPVVGGVFRALVTLQGTLEVLSPGFQMLDEARSVGAELLREAMAPSSLRSAATSEALGMLPIFRRLPRRVDHVAAALERGTLSVGVRPFADERDVNVLKRLVNRGVLAFLGAALGVIAVQLLGLSGGPTLAPAFSAYQLFGYLSLFLSIVLILRVVIAITRERLG
jgi:ubiquinone biosynthesis protein